MMELYRRIAAIYNVRARGGFITVGVDDGSRPHSSLSLLQTARLLHHEDSKVCVGLTGGRFDDSFVTYLERFPRIATLWLEGPRITGEADWAKLADKSLSSVVLWNTHVIDAGIDELTSSLLKLLSVDIVGGSFGEVGIRCIGRLQRLQSLRLSNVEIGDSMMSTLSVMPGLVSLDVSDTDCRDDALSLMNNVRHLSVSGTQITDRGINYLQDSQCLKSLIVERTSLTDEALPVIAGIASLVAVCLGGTGVSGQGVRWLRTTRPDVEVLDVQLFDTALSIPSAEEDGTRKPV